ncbi:MAG: DUF4405 domain-containing protein [Bacteroidales bacterium]|jgi:hypothetical protein|nr:DUF4405 domain-containing protein [Bacteroidales bacterium]
MKSKKNKWLNKFLKVFLYILLATGVVYTLMLYNILPPGNDELWGGLHRISGFVFLIFVLVHCIKNRKWYKAWFTQKLKNKKSRLAKFISVSFVLMLLSVMSEDLFTQNQFVLIHILIGSVWILGILSHFNSKKY